MITVFRSTKYARPQFSYGLAPMPVWLTGESAITAAALAVSAYLSDRELEAYSKALRTPERFENYQDHDGDYGTSTIYWRGQTFTPQTTHVITSVKLLCGITGLHDEAVVSIRATSGGLPTGADLVVKSVDPSGFATSPAYDWEEWVFDTGIELTASVQYAIVVRYLGGAGPGTLLIRNDYSAPAYTDGQVVYSQNSGVTWGITGRDYAFEEWGCVSKLAADQYINDRDFEAYMKGIL